MTSHVRPSCEPMSLSDVHPTVLLETRDFVGFDKPPDVRMDGDHVVTMEKLFERIVGGKPKWVRCMPCLTKS